MNNLLGLLRIKVKRGINLAVRDYNSTSDPYVIIRMGDQRLKTRVIDKNLNPVWNEDLTLSIEDPDLPIKLAVFDHDLLSKDDDMGDAEFDIKPVLEARKMQGDTLPNGTILKRVKPGRENFLAEESCITWKDGKVVQEMCLRLQHVESGVIELALFWIDLPGTSNR